MHGHSSWLFWVVQQLRTESANMVKKVSIRELNGLDEGYLRAKVRNHLIAHGAGLRIKDRLSHINDNMADYNLQSPAVVEVRETLGVHLWEYSGAIS